MTSTRLVFSRKDLSRTLAGAALRRNEKGFSPALFVDVRPRYGVGYHSFVVSAVGQQDEAEVLVLDPPEFHDLLAAYPAGGAAAWVQNASSLVAERLVPVLKQTGYALAWI